jgi:hypothetical protein
MPVKIARSAPQASFGLPTVTAAVTTWLLSCRKAGKVQILYIRWRAIWGIPVKVFPCPPLASLERE